jgi:hypothetical protein
MDKNDIIIHGGIDMEVMLLTGETRLIKVKLLKISQFEAYLRAVDNEPRAAELLCEKEEGWGDTLTADSLLNIVEKGHDINFTSVFRWAQRRTNINEIMLPIAQKGQAMAQALPNSVRTQP